MTWQQQDFLIATTGGPATVSGYVYRHLGLHERALMEWSLTHLGSGHQICRLEGRLADVCPVASEIAECGDWGFDGLRGYLNCDPGLGERARAIMDRLGVRYLTNDAAANDAANDAIARAVAIARAQ